MNLYINGEIETYTSDASKVTFVTETKYPKTGDVKITVKLQSDKEFNPAEGRAPYSHIVEVQVPLKNGTLMTVKDYGSTGKTCADDSKMAAWMLTE